MAQGTLKHSLFWESNRVLCDYPISRRCNNQRHLINFAECRCHSKQHDANSKNSCIRFNDLQTRSGNAHDSRCGFYALSFRLFNGYPASACNNIAANLSVTSLCHPIYPIYDLNDHNMRESFTHMYSLF